MIGMRWSKNAQWPKYHRETHFWPESGEKFQLNEAKMFVSFRLTRISIPFEHDSGAQISTDDSVTVEAWIETRIGSLNDQLRLFFSGGIPSQFTNKFTWFTCKFTWTAVSKSIQILGMLPPRLCMSLSFCLLSINFPVARMHRLNGSCLVNYFRVFRSHKRQQ